MQVRLKREAAIFTAYRDALRQAGRRRLEGAMAVEVALEAASAIAQLTHDSPETDPYGFPMAKLPRVA